MIQEEIKKYAEILLGLIPEDGSPKGNITLIQDLTQKLKRDLNVAISEDEYWEIRNDLIEKGDISTGKGKGGSVYRSLGIAKGTKAKSTKESDIYESFFQTINKSWVKQNDIKEFQAEITAAQGRRKTGGKWTRPDITLVAVRNFAFIPEKILEVVTFEIKPSFDTDVSGVFETAAHSVFAHKSYLAILISDENQMEFEEFQRLERLCKKFGIGLIVFSDPANWTTFDERIEPERKSPDPSDVNSFIRTQLKNETQNSILEMIK